MTEEKLSIEQFVKDQVKKWESMHPAKGRKEEAQIPVITVSMQPGASGSVVARKIAEHLNFDFFHRDIIKGIAESAKISDSVVETLEKERLSGVEDFISSLVNKQYLYPGLYLEHLMQVVCTIAEHGRAVIVGRGANFILPLEKRFSVRIVAPQSWRIKNVSKDYDISIEEAKRRVMRTESDRRAFIRKYFNADIADPTNYDLTINTATLKVDDAVNVISAALGLVECVFVG